MALFQYKPEYYARKIPLSEKELDGPKEIGYLYKSYLNFGKEDQKFGGNPSWESSAKYVIRQHQGEPNKFVLLELQRKIVIGLHPSLKTEYVQVQTQNPFETSLNNIRPIIAWVESKWIEPLTPIFNYETEAKQKALESLKKKWVMIQ